MHTPLSPEFANTPEGKEAQDILRACVHCGLCTATCPTYQLLGDERDSPRGRIYLIKQVLQGATATQSTLTHLDRCLTCRACETTCPAGVRYGRLLDIGRDIVEKQVRRPLSQRLSRKALTTVLPYLGRLTRSPRSPKNHPRQMLLLNGCVQPLLAPRINAAALQVFDALGIELIIAPQVDCCGALSYHNSAQADGLAFMRRNIDAWLPYLDKGIEAIVSTASGCGVMLKDYGVALQHDANYAVKAQRIAAAAKDVVEIVNAENLNVRASAETIAFQSPCTLQHGQQLSGTVEQLLQGLGFMLCVVNDAQLCCGSAGMYSLLQPELSQQLLRQKLTALQHAQPDVIATANIGCLRHLQSQAAVPVKHWLEIVAAAL